MTPSDDDGVSDDVPSLLKAPHAPAPGVDFPVPTNQKVASVWCLGMGR